MSKEYEVKVAEIFPVTKRKVKSDKYTFQSSADDDSPHKHDDSQTKPKTQRKAKVKANEKLRLFQVFNDGNVEIANQQCRLSSEPKTNHAWNYSDWLELCQEEDDIIVKNAHTVQDNALPNISQPTDAPEHRLPSLNSLLRYNIRELNTQAQSSSALLQRFLPEDEPELMWDHSPEFLAEDGQMSWTEDVDIGKDIQDIDKDLESALKPRKLFQGQDYCSESLTSTDSEDSLFFDTRTYIHSSPAIIRSDVTRRAVRKRTTPQSECNIDDRTTEVLNSTDDDANQVGFVVSNLSQLEMELDSNDYAIPTATKNGLREEGLNDTDDSTLDKGLNNHDEDTLENGMVNRDGTTEDNNGGNSRRKRSNRKIIDYKRLNSVGFQ